jgi:hypothetical protein
MSKQRDEANEVFTVARTEARQHGPADFNLACPYFRHETMSGCCKFGVHESAIPGQALSSYQPSPLQTVKR